ncbi:MAG: SDR family oxidoreductase [Cyanobacteria bacterium P01_G01_bin.49]
MQPELKRVLVVGASRGIGASVAQHFKKRGHHVIAVSRTLPVTGEWIQADIATAEGIRAVADAIDDTRIDALLYMGGVWENNAFTHHYDFMTISDEETRYVISVNTIAPIEITRQLANNLAKSDNPRAIFMGSVSGLENCASKEVANTASKFGLRGAVQSLRLALHSHNIGFTVINPGNVATEEVLADINEGRFPLQVPIPIKDLISSIEWILALSSAVDVVEINLQQR